MQPDRFLEFSPGCLRITERDLGWCIGFGRLPHGFFQDFLDGSSGMHNADWVGSELETGVFMFGQ
jgi:hypothetical protein